MPFVGTRRIRCERIARHILNLCSINGYCNNSSNMWGGGGQE